MFVDLLMKEIAKAEGYFAHTGNKPSAIVCRLNNPGALRARTGETSFYGLASFNSAEEGFAELYLDCLSAFDNGLTWEQFFLQSPGSRADRLSLGSRVLCELSRKTGSSYQLNERMCLRG